MCNHGAYAQCVSSTAGYYCTGSTVTAFFFLVHFVFDALLLAVAVRGA
jgi:hypothetical protein